MGGRRKTITWNVDSRGCHVCTSHKLNTHGYPSLWKNGRPHNGQRVIYEEKIGPVPSGLVVRHKCDNRACINPKHLVLGTWADNSNDMSVRGRCNTKRGEGRADTKLTSKQVIEIRNSTGTQDSVAATFGVSQSTISRIKRFEKRQYDGR